MNIQNNLAALLSLLLFSTIISGVGPAQAGIVVFHADFDQDTVGEKPSTDLPGAPDGDTFRVAELSGSIRVQSDLAGFTGQHVLLDREDSPNIFLTALVDPDLQFCKRYTVRWRAAMRQNVFFFACTARSPNQGLVSAVEYRSGGGLSFSGSDNPLSVHYYADVPQLFEMTIDFPGRVASLSIDGVPVPEAQDIPFYQPGSDGLKSLGFEPGGLATLQFAADGIHIEGFECAGVPVEQQSWSTIKGTYGPQSD